jgi:hypothetical protein
MLVLIFLLLLLIVLIMVIVLASVDVYASLGIKGVVVGTPIKNSRSFWNRIVSSGGFV